MTITFGDWFASLFGRLRAPTTDQEIVAHGGESREPGLVYTAKSAFEADLVVALLDSEGIPAFATGSALSQLYGLQVGAAAEVQVWVNQALAERARAIIEERHLGADDDMSDVDVIEDDDAEGFSLDS